MPPKKKATNNKQQSPTIAEEEKKPVPRTRSSRSLQVSYKEDSEDEDFTQIKPRQATSRKRKSKESVDEDFEAGSSSDEELEAVDENTVESNVSENEIPARGKKRARVEKIVERRPSLSAIFKPVNLSELSNKALKLSDSESDGEENVPAAASPTIKDEPETAESMDVENSNTITENAVEIWSRNLSALGIVSSDKPTEKSKKKEQKGKKTPKKTKKVDTSDVAKLLKLGGEKEEEEESEDENWESVEIPVNETPKVKQEQETNEPKDVQIMVALPEGKKKRKFDFLEHVRKKMNRIRKLIQADIHKVHITCLLASSHYINMILNDTTLMGSALSIIPSNQCYPPKRTDLVYLEKLVSWFTKKFQLEKKKDYYPVPLFKCLMKCFASSQGNCIEEYVFVFIVICRALGMSTRLVISLQPSPLKVKGEDLMPNDKKKDSDENEAEPGTSKDSESKKTKEKPQRGRKKTNVKENEEDRKKSRGKAKEEKKETNKKKGKEVEEKKQGKGKAVKENVTTRERKSLRSQRNQTKYAEVPSNSDSDSDSDFDDSSKSRKPKKTVNETPKKVLVKQASRKIVSSESEGPPAETKKKSRDSVDLWAEVYLEHEEQWISVDVTSGKVHCDRYLESHTHPVYIVAFNPDGTHKDVTRRYASSFHNVTRKLRVEPDWWKKLMDLRKEADSPRSRAEDKVFEQQLMERPLPTSIAEYKNHPLYVLRRHLLKFEAIYPPSAVALGYVRGEPVYARECVKQLHSRETWLKEAKVVRLGEKPYKIVKARPKWDKITKKVVTDQPLEIFGEWQVEDYVPPPAVDGKVPRNAYGNVELFKPSMLPKGTVHLPIAGLNKVARKLGIDCAPAMTGWDYHGGWSHPVYDGFVVCEEHVEPLLDAWQADQAEQERRDREKREKRVYDNWRRLIRGLLIKKRLEAKYLNLTEEVEPSAVENPEEASTSTGFTIVKPPMPVLGGPTKKETVKSRRRSSK